MRSSLNTSQLQANPLSIARTRPPRSEPSHPSGGGGEGTARPRSGGCFFHHPEDVRAGGSGEPRRSVAANWPRKNPGHVALSKRAGPSPAPIASALRSPEVEEAPAATALKRRPGGCCYPTPPTPGACNALGPASARLLPARSGLVRAAVCRPGSSPSPRYPPALCLSHTLPPRSSRLQPPPP